LCIGDFFIPIKQNIQSNLTRHTHNHKIVLSTILYLKRKQNALGIQAAIANWGVILACKFIK
jgi:hypothetical protein